MRKEYGTKEKNVKCSGMMKCQRCRNLLEGKKWSERGTYPMQIEGSEERSVTGGSGEGQRNAENLRGGERESRSGEKRRDL